MLCKQSALPIRLPQYAGALPALMGLEMPLVRLLAAMEARGIALDAAVLEQQQPAMKKRMEQLQAAATLLVGGRPLELSSHVSVRDALFKHLALPVPPHAKMCARNTLSCSTSLEILGACCVVEFIMSASLISPLLPPSLPPHPPHSQTATSTCLHQAGHAQATRQPMRMCSRSFYLSTSCQALCFSTASFPSSMVAM